jgi:uncharacterized repeat protein (TIGR01451 family)
MHTRRSRTLAHALAIVAIIFAAVAGAGARLASAADNPTEPGTVINNSAEAVYNDASGRGFRTVSPTVSVTVKAVSGLVVTPDETEPSAAVVAGERAVRLFRVCNTGNTPDLYTITRADVSAPSAVASLHFDTDASGTLGDGDRLIQIGTTLSPRLSRGACAGVLASVDTNAVEPGARLTISITARSSVLDTANGAVEDVGTIINAVGNGALLAAPDDTRLPPAKTVEGRERVTAAYGQTLNYQIAFRNHGDVTARSVVVRDDLPEGLEYVSGTLKLGKKNLTDAADTDEGSYANRRIEVRLAEVKIGELVQIYFQARVTQGVAPGAGVVNAAALTAANAPAAKTTDAVAVVSPFGVVYEGNGGGSAVIAGARVALLADATTGVPLALSNAGADPNVANANPFSTDGLGRWSFSLAPAQLGAAGSPVRYYLNVTAQGFRSRMIEVTVEPSAPATSSSASSGELFTLNVRALDNQPVARRGGFELTTEVVSVPGLAAFALNVPMFENSAVEIQKTADRPAAEVGDIVTYRVEVHNATDSAMLDAIVTDTLPASFHYAEGSARADIPPAAGARPVEPEHAAGGALVFKLGTVPAGARALLTYRVRIGANAREGEQINSATAAGRLSVTGERVTTQPARASVRVRRGVFSSQQVIVGRVFEDANRNGLFEDGERAMPGVRLYLNNGQSVMTDSAGQYNFPVVGEGSHVIALDPVTLPGGYSLSDSNRRDQKTWTRLLRTPLGGGAMLRQNFALIPPPDADGGAAPSDRAANFTQSGAARGPARAAGGNGGDAAKAATETASARQLSSGTYEVEATETIEPVAAGKVVVVSPRSDGVISGAALEVEARVAAGWAAHLEVNGERVPDSKIGERRADHKNKVTTYAFVGLNAQPGPNRIKVTAVSPDGAAGESTELVAFGRGPAKRLEIIPSKTELSAGGRDRATLRVRALDQWGNPAADGAVALEVSAGRLLRVGRDAARVDGRGADGKAGASEKSGRGVSGDANALNAELNGAQADARQQVIALSGGEGFVELASDAAAGAVEIRATTGAAEAESRVRITPEVRPSILVGLAEVSVGAAAPEIALHDSDENSRRRLAFFFRGPVFGKNLLTLSYDSQRPINRTSGNDRLFHLDPLERAYTLFGDSSTRYEDALSNSKLYARLDRGRSYLMFGDYDTENREAGLASFSRRLTGVKLHVENSKGDFVSVSGARPDTAFARDVFEGGALGIQRLSRADILPGSEVVTIEVRDRRNPEVVLSREPLARSIDYNLNASTGEIFFLRPISTFDYQLNLVQVVVQYEHRAEGMSSAVYTARAVKNFEGLGLKVGLSAVEQTQGEFGSFFIGGVDAEKKLPDGGRLKAEWATSRGRAAFSGNLFSAGGGNNPDGRHDGNAFRAELEQPLPFREAQLRASFLRADQNFMNPFGATVSPGSRRADIALDMRVRRSSRLRLGFTDERNRTANVDNSRRTASVLWTENVGESLRATVGYDARSYEDNISGRETNSNLLTVGAEWQATDKLQLSVKREQNLSEADPTYPNQTTLAANYQHNQFTRLFFTQRLSSAPITPIGDFSATALPPRARAGRRPSASKRASAATPTSTPATSSRTASAARTASPSSASRIASSSRRSSRSTSATNAASTSRARARASTTCTSVWGGSPTRISAHRRATKCATAAAWARSSRPASPGASATT